MPATHGLLHIGMLLILLASTSLSGPLTSKQEARLHPAFRMLLHGLLDANGQLQAAPPDLAVEKEAIIFTSNTASLRTLGINVQSVYDGFVTAFVRPSDLLRLAQTDAVDFVDPGVESFPRMDISLGATGVSLLHAGFLNNISFKGQGAIVLIYDTGIDWKHLDFRGVRDPARSRILSIWDQTLSPASGESSPSGFTYGVEYSKAQIDNEIDGSPVGFVREADLSGHGTHVAGIAAGNGASAGGKYTGMAPLADIIIVKGGEGTFTEARIIDGLTYAQQKAAAFDKPLVVNMSFGGQTGPHDGTLAEEIAINSFVSTPGRVVCISGGNDGSSRIHRTGTVPPAAADTLQVVVPSYTPTPGGQNDKFTLDVWCDGSENANVIVISPTGITYSRNAGETGSAPDQTDGTIEAWNYLSPLNTHRNIQVSVADWTLATPRAGPWRIIITNTGSSPLAYNAWLPSRTVGNHEASLTGGDALETVTSPGTCSGGITVGSCVTRYSWPALDGGQYIFTGSTDRVGNISLFSSIGPTADGRLKPDVAAPGENILSSLSGSIDMSGKKALVSPDGKHTVMEGTSMAAPHVTGAAAVLLGADPSLSAAQIKSLLETTADGDAFASGLPNNVWGYGKLDILEAMAKSIDPGAVVKRTIISYDQAGPGYYWQLTGSSKYAIRFSSPDSGRLAGVEVGVYTQNIHAIAGNGSLVCEVRSDGGGSPGERIGNAVDVPFALLNPGTYNSLTLLPAQAGINAGTDYYMVLSLSSPGDTLALLSDASTSGSRSLIYDGARWSGATRNFRIRPIVVSASGNFTGGGSLQPVAFELLQNFPNPFNLTTEISYSIPSTGHVSLRVFDILGREVATLIDGDENEGTHYVSWGATGRSKDLVSSGVYFYRLESDGMKKTRKMILLK